MIMGSVFEPKNLSKKPRKKIYHDSIKDILPDTPENLEENKIIKLILINCLIRYFIYIFI